MIELIVESANSRDRVPLPEDGVVGVGTDSKCAVQIQDSDVARMHCVLRGAEGRWTVENCESSSGTWVNDDEIRRRELVPGDVIRIGTTRITVSEANAESPAAPPRPKSPAGPAPTPSASTKGAATRGAAAPNSARGKAARPAPSRGPAPKRRPRPKSGGTHPAILVAIGLVTLVLGFVVVKEATREPVQKRDRELSQDEKPKRRKKTKRSLSEAERLRQRRLAREIPEEDSQDDEQEQQKENERSLEEADANAAKPVAKRVDGLIAEGKLRDASDALAAFTRDHTYDITLAPQRRALERAVRELVTKARGEVEALSKNGKQVEANAVLDNLETALPEDQADRVLALRDELDEAFRERNARLRDVDKAKLSIARALADLDEKKATDLLEEVGKVAGRKSATYQSLATETKAILKAFADLRSALVTAGEKKTSIKALEWSSNPLAPLPRSGGKTKRYRVLPLEGGPELAAAIRLESGTRKSRVVEVRPLFSIDLEELATLVGDKDDGFKDSLATLAHFRRATGNEASTGAFAKINLESLRRRARRRTVESIRKSGATLLDGDVWTYAAREIVQLFRSVEDEAEREELADAYVEVRTEGLRLDPGPDLFYAQETELKDGYLTLTYDFSTEKQLDAFHIDKDDDDSRIEWRKNQLVLTGEARLFRGAPFVEKIAVSGVVASKGYDPTAPNINLALWTKDGQTISGIFKSGDLRRLAERFRGGRRGDDDDDDRKKSTAYIALGMGYKVDFSLDNISRRYRRFAEGLLPEWLDEPSFVLFTGEKGKPLHSSFDDDSIWHTPSGTKMRGGSFKFGALSSGKNFRWSVGSSLLPYTKAENISRVEVAEDQSGSVTFFTNDSTVAFRKIEVAGNLNVDWISKQARAIAKKERKRLGGL